MARLFFGWGSIKKSELLIGSGAILIFAILLVYFQQ
jgi:hypothetical protein